MKLNLTSSSTRVGNVEVKALSRVTELDAGVITGPDEYKTLDNGTNNVAISHVSLHAIEQQLAIIIPCMNEEASVLLGVLHGVPHTCLIILVSNSNANNHQIERRMLANFCAQTERQGITIHQRDSVLASAFTAAGMPHIVDVKGNTGNAGNAGHIRNGKGEAMMIGVVLAKLAGKKFVGFVDADNFVPGAVYEYCKVFAAGLHHVLHSANRNSIQADEPLAMVRIKWKSKPKIVDGKLVSKEAGRCSEMVNEWMNSLLASVAGENNIVDLIVTANAGEHAMSTDLALQLNFATGYAVEPFQLVDLWERSGIIPPAPLSNSHAQDVKALLPSLGMPFERKVQVMQIETLNPHIHDFGKGDEHILRMQRQGLGTIYHSNLASQTLKTKLQEHVEDKLSAIAGQDGRLGRLNVYPAMDGLDWTILEEILKAHGCISMT